MAVVARSDNGSLAGSQVMAIVIAIVVVIALIGIGLFAMGQLVETSYDNVDAIVQLSGNDVVVTILGGENADKIVALHAYIDGVGDPNAPGNTKRPIVIGEPVPFSNLARGVTGTGFVVVEAIFSDGSQGVVTYSRMKFS